jgi:hypothetical protein
MVGRTHNACKWSFPIVSEAIAGEEEKMKVADSKSRYRFGSTSSQILLLVAHLRCYNDVFAHFMPSPAKG